MVRPRAQAAALSLSLTFAGPLHVQSCQAQPPVTEVAASCPRCGSRQLLVYLPLLKDGLFLLLPEIVCYLDPGNTI